MRMHRLAAAAALLLLTTAAPIAAAPPDRTELAKQKFAAVRRNILFQAGTDRVRLGEWCRNAGLVGQATASFVRAVDESEGKNFWAVKVLDLMRRLDDKFWKTVNAHPGKAYLDTFDKKARKLDEDRQEALFKLAKDGHKDGLVDEALGVWNDLERETERPMVFDEKGHVVLPAGVVPEEPSARMKAAAITVNGALYLRDAFLELVPDVVEVRESLGDRVRLRVQGAGDPPHDLRVSLEALTPYLEDDVGGRPTRRLYVFVFTDRATFRKYVDAAKMSGFGVASGFADGATNTAIVCADGLELDSVRGMCMHEMSHLYQYAVTPVVMPSWYAEGFAETYGGDGTFTWKDGTLTAGGKLSDGELAAVRAPEGYIRLSDLLAGDALKLLTQDKALGRRFYSESWAFLRFLRTAASADVQARFRLWETACRGAALGAQAGKPREQDTAPAAGEFSRRFAMDLPAIEKAFRDWLAKP